MRAVAVLAIAGVTLMGCGTDGSPTGLPSCAAELPLPDAIEVVEVTATPEPDNPTCAVTLASDRAIDEVVASWQRALERAGVSHAVQHQAGRQAVLQLDGPVCGSVLVFAAGTERITDAVAADRTPTLASVTECTQE